MSACVATTTERARRLYEWVVHSRSLYAGRDSRNGQPRGSMLGILVSGRRIPKLVSTFLFATMILALCYSLGYLSTNAFLTAGSGLF